MRIAAALALIFSLSISGASAQQAISLDNADVVFDWSTQRCDKIDIPDAPMHAVRLANGTVLGFASHYETRLYRGQTVDGLRHDCTPVYRSDENAEPSDFDDRTWLTTPFTDGQTVWALTHMEYHGEMHPGHCVYATLEQCWYVSVGLVASTDGGQSWSRVGSRPILAPNSRFEDAEGARRGSNPATNLVKDGGFYYSLIKIEENGSRGICVLRASVPSDPSSWTFYDGQNWVPSARDPYKDPATRLRPCHYLENLVPRVVPDSLVRRESTGEFLLAGDDVPGDAVAISSSHDMIHWTAWRPLLSMPTMHRNSCPAPYAYAYASLIDPASASANFESVSDSPYLFLTRFHMQDCHQTPDRDLIRLRVHL